MSNPPTGRDGATAPGGGHLRAEACHYCEPSGCQRPAPRALRLIAPALAFKTVTGDSCGCVPGCTGEFVIILGLLFARSSRLLARSSRATTSGETFKARRVSPTHHDSNKRTGLDNVPGTVERVGAAPAARSGVLALSQSPLAWAIKRCWSPRHRQAACAHRGKSGWGLGCFRDVRDLLELVMASRPGSRGQVVSMTPKSEKLPST